jgi:hypothetical protein
MLLMLSPVTAFSQISVLVLTEAMTANMTKKVPGFKD